MKSLSVFSVPIGLAVAAAFLNASVLTSRLEPVEVISLSRPIPSGTPLRQSDLKPVTLYYPSQSLQQYFWRWDERGEILGKAPTSELLGSLLPRSAFRLRGANLTAPEDGMVVGLRCPESAFERGTTISGITTATVMVETSSGKFGPFTVAGARAHKADDDTVISLFLTVSSTADLDLESAFRDPVIRITSVTGS